MMLGNNTRAVNEYGKICRGQYVSSTLKMLIKEWELKCMRWFKISHR